MDRGFFCETNDPNEYFECFMQGLMRRNEGEPEFHQAVEEVARSIVPYIFKNRQYLDGRILERMTEPDRIVIFRVCWEDDDGNVRTNRGFRVQFNNSIGPYKGGLRFHPTVSQSVLKFLGFEQVFKNSLTSLPMGAGKGGANFNPAGKSEREIMRFCQAYMTELYRHIGEDLDVPAGDIGVGGREVSYMFGQYKRICNRFAGILTGKGIEFGGSLIRKEATGYGTVYFAEHMLEHVGQKLEGSTCLVSGAGNVAQYATEKLTELGAKVVSLSDSGGTIHDPDGIDADKLAFVTELKLRRGSLREYAEKFNAKFLEKQRPWSIPCDYAFPSATQNEIQIDDAKVMIQNGCKGVFEGANMPSDLEAINAFKEAGVLFGPSKAANAGGVAISGLEMTQNSMRLSWNRDEVDAKLKEIMKSIHDKCLKYGTVDGKTNYVDGANIGGFVKVADAMLAYGVN